MFSFRFRLYGLSKISADIKMAAIVNLYWQMLTGVRLEAHADSIKPAETMIKII